MRWSVVLLPFLLVSVVPTGHAQVEVDVAVTDVQVIGPDPRWVDGEAQDTRIRATVTNHGSAPATYTISYHWDEEGRFLNGDAPSSTDVSNGFLGPGESVRHEADWVLGDDQRGAGRILAIVEAEEDVDASNDRKSLDVDVPVHALDLAWQQHDTRIHADETRFFRLRVHNGGLQDEDLSVWVDEEPAQPAPFLYTLEPASLTVAPGATEVVHLVVEFPFQSGVHPHTTTYTVHVGDPGDAVLQKSSAPLALETTEETFDPAEYGARLERLDDTFWLDPAPAQKVVRFLLTNTGTADDTYDVTTTISGQWFAEPDASTIHLVGGESRPVEVDVGPHPEAIPGSSEMIELRVSSRHRLHPDRVLTADLALQGPVVEVRPSGWPRAFYQGHPSELPVRVVNTGTSEAPPGALNVSAMWDGGSLEGFPQESAVPAVPAGGSYTLSVPFHPAPEVEIPIERRFVFLDNLTNGRFDPYESVYLTFEKDIDTVHALDVRIATSLGGAHPGDRVRSDDLDATAAARSAQREQGTVVPLDYHVAVADLDDDVEYSVGDSVYLLPCSDVCVVDSGSIRLTGSGNLSAGTRVSPDDEDRGQDLLVGGVPEALPVFIDVDRDGLLGPLEEVYLDMDGSGDASILDLRLGHGFGSQLAAGDPEIGSLFDMVDTYSTFAPDVQGPVSLALRWEAQGVLAPPGEAVEQVFVRSAGIEVTPPNPLQTVAGQRVEYLVPPMAFQVRNTGNSREQVQISAASEPGSVEVGSDLLELAPGEARTVPVMQIIPSTVSSDTAALTLRAQLVDHPDLAETATVLVSVLDVAAPDVTFVDLPTLWDVRKPLRVQVEVTDDRGAESVVLLVSGDPREMSWTGDTWEAELDLDVGLHSLAVTASDAAGHVGRIEAEILVEDVPPPRFLGTAPKDGSTVRSGAPLRVWVEDDLAIERVRVGFDGREPEEIEVLEPDSRGRVEALGSFEVGPGPHDLIVEVTNEAGRTTSASASFNVTLRFPADREDAGHDAPGAPIAAVILAIIAVYRRRP